MWFSQSFAPSGFDKLLWLLARGRGSHAHWRILASKTSAESWTYSETLEPPYVMGITKYSANVLPWYETEASVVFECVSDVNDLVFYTDMGMPLIPKWMCVHITHSGD